MVPMPTITCTSKTTTTVMRGRWHRCRSSTRSSLCCSCRASAPDRRQSVPSHLMYRTRSGRWESVPSMIYRASRPGRQQSVLSTLMYRTLYIFVLVSLQPPAGTPRIVVRFGAGYAMVVQRLVVRFSPGHATDHATDQWFVSVPGAPRIVHWPWFCSVPVQCVIVGGVLVLRHHLLHDDGEDDDDDDEEEQLIASQVVCWLSCQAPPDPRRR